VRRLIDVCFRLLVVPFIGLATAHATSVPDTALDDLNAGGIVYSIAASADTLYIGGTFTSVDGTMRNGLAAIDRSTGAVVAAWDPGLDSPATVYAIALSADGNTLYVGGSFSVTVGTITLNNIAEIDTQTGSVMSAWNPDADGVVRALALAPGGGTLYAGGDFGQVGAATRARLAAISTAGAGSATPWNPGADATVRTLAVSPDGARVYVGGDFLIVDGQVRRRLAALLATSGAASAWNPDIDPAIANGKGVYALALTANGETLYVGGDFTDIDGKTLPWLVALDTVATTAGSIADPLWSPAPNGTVRALRLSYDENMIYAGGDFTNIGGQVRANLSKLKISDATSVLGWDPGTAIVAGSPVVYALGSDPDRSALYAGGDFDINAGVGVTKHGIAAFAVGAPVTVATPPGGGYQDSYLDITFHCTDNGGLDCTSALRTYYTTDGSEPTESSQVYDPANVFRILSNTDLRFYSVDAEENSETKNIESYVIGDMTAPSTTNSPVGGLYGTATLQPVTLICDDNVGGSTGSGCAATYYTLDGSLPTTSSAVYSAPISLGALFPPPGIASADVDPLQDLAGPVTLKYFSVDAAGNSEADLIGIHSENFFVDLAAPVVSASLVSGSYTPPQTVTITCDDGVGSGCAAMYYTLDDTTPSDQPTTDSQGNVVMPVLYTGPLTLSAGAIINVLAIDNAGNRSTALVGIYSFSSEKGSTRGVGAFGPGMLAVVVLMVVWRLRGGRARGVSGGSAASP